MTKIMVLNGSFRPHGFTDSLIRSFKAGAESRGHEVTVFPLRAMDIHPCVGCLHGGRDTARPCTQSDDMDRIYDTYRESDVIVFATPLFFWTYSGLLKMPWTVSGLWQKAGTTSCMGTAKAGLSWWPLAAAIPSPSWTILIT